MLENFLCLPLFLCFSVVEQNTCKKPQIPHIFGDHMVIQRDKPIRMWGSAEPEATVQVRLAELHYQGQPTRHMVARTRGTACQRRRYDLVGYFQFRDYRISGRDYWRCLDTWWTE